MALHWSWSEKCGEAVVSIETGRGIEDYTVSLYQGNAFLIMLNEFEEDGKTMWTMFDFLLDKDHMKNCFGLNKKGGYETNIFNSSYKKLKKIKINKKKYSYTKELVTALVQAFDQIEIELVSE